MKMKFTSKEQALNALIAVDGVDTGKISDGYHTFEDLYNHRSALFIILCRMVHEDDDRADKSQPVVWKSRRSYEGIQTAGWFIMGLGMEEGKMITYHMDEKYWHKTFFAHEYDKVPFFDGHDSDDVLERILNFKNVKRLFTDKGWDKFFMGNDFCFTMYLDGVKQQYAPTSRSSDRKSFDDYSLVEYFQKFRNK